MFSSVKSCANKAKSTLPFSLFVITLITLLSALTPNVHAQSTVTFAQFFERSGGQDFVFTNNNGTDANFKTVTNGSPIFFLYQNISGLPAELQGIQNATLIITSNITQAGSVSSNVVNQPFNQTTTITIFRDTPASVGSGSRRNLLTVSFSPNLSSPLLTGADQGNSATFSATTSPVSPDQTVVFVSDFLRFDATTSRNLAFSLSSVLPQLTLGSGGYAQSFTAAGSGTFASNPPPVYNPPPTAATASIGGRVTTQNGYGIGRVRVTMVDGNGIPSSTITNFSGYYRFNDVPVNQNYFFSVSSRTYQFTEPLQFWFVNGNYYSLNFTADR